MTEAIFGLLGVLIGAGVTWFQAYWTNRTERDRSARYLAIRVVCVLDKFVEDCLAVVMDDGLICGQLPKDGLPFPQVPSPGAPFYPDDVDWGSIDHDLMYKILSLPSDVEASDRRLEFTWDDVQNTPDVDVFFNERAFWYACSGMRASKLAQKLSKEYDIPTKTYVNWNPAAELEKKLRAIQKRHKKHDKDSVRLIDKILEAA